MGMLCSLARLIAALGCGAGLAGAAEPIRHEVQHVGADFFEKNRPAAADRWVPPACPPELKGTWPSFPLRIRYTVDEHGDVREPEVLTGDQEFREAALAAIRQWHYRPELVDGKPVALGLEVTFDFRPLKPGQLQEANPPFPIAASEMRPPEESGGGAPDPVYPKHLEKRQLFGEVALKLAVDETGRVTGVEVERATHADFLSAAFAAVEQWRLQPARQGRVPKKGEKEAVLSFTVVDTEVEHVARNEWLERNGIALREPGAQKPALFFDTVPEAEVFVDPVHPAALRQAGVTGTAQVDFTVDQQGRVVEAAVRNASHPDFGDALVAAVVAWRFKPMYHGGEAVRMDLTARWKFELPTADNTLPEALAALEPSAPRANPRQLDRPLELLFTRSPIRPPGAPTTGLAEIEVTINRSGRVCWPRIRQASNPALGWAAATAVSQWYFATPRKDGQPVDVQAIIPVEFRADAEASQ